jgi:HSP20 family protein
MTQLSSILPSFGRQQASRASVRDNALVKPVYTVREEKEDYEVTVYLPGVAKSGLEVHAEQNELSIVARRSWTPPAGWAVLYRETPQADFGLTLDHEGNIDAEKITAELNQGVLHIKLPKAEAFKPRRIAIQ